MHLYFLHVFATEEQDHHFHADARARLLTRSRTWFSAAAMGSVDSCHLNMPTGNPWDCRRLAQPLD